MTAPALQTYVQGQSVCSADNLNTFMQTCDNDAQLRGIVGVVGMQIYARGTTAINDGGQGMFYWNATSSAADNNSTVIVPNGAGATGRWIRLGSEGSSVGTSVVPSLVVAEATIFASSISFVITGGYYTAGDKGGGEYRRVGSNPGHGGAFQDASGAWFLLSSTDINFNQFGAHGNGVNDDTAALQSAIDSGISTEIYGVPGAAYYLNNVSGINITSKLNLNLLGNGASIKIGTIATQLMPSAGGATQILMTGCSNSSFSGWTIDGNAKAVNAFGCYNSTDCMVENNTGHSCGVNGIFVLWGNTRGRYRFNTIYSSFGLGIWAGNNLVSSIEHEAQIVGNISLNNAADGIGVRSIGGLVSMNYCDGNGGSGIILTGSGGFTCQRIRVIGNGCANNGFHGIQSDVNPYSTDADLTQDITLTANICTSNGAPHSGTGIYAVNALRWTLQGNICNDNYNAGIQVGAHAKHIVIGGSTCVDTRTGGSRTQLQGIRLQTQGSVTISDVTLTGNSCQNNTEVGIAAQASNATSPLQGVVVSGNQCDLNDLYGIFCAEVTPGDVSNLIVDGNRCGGNGSGDIRTSVLDVLTGNNVYATQQDYQSYTALSGATPSVTKRTWYNLTNGGATTVTAINGGVVGQVINLQGTDANTTIQNNSSIVLKGAVNAAVPSGGIITLRLVGATWYEVSRSF